MTELPFRLFPTDERPGCLESRNRMNGPSTLNTPQIVVLSYVDELPFFKNEHNFQSYALGGWEISGITNVQSGQSVTATQGTARLLL